jgi:SAM-dependent methyltransferase
MSEFDRYTNDYQTMLHESLSLLGGFNDYYLLQKVNFLKKTTDQTNVHSILDFGCGLGGTTLMLKNAFPESRVVGVDVSELSLEKARQHASGVEFGSISDEVFMASCIGVFDIIYVANVFHHVPPESRISVMDTLKSMLASNGEIFFFEHNPYNPITKWVVSRCKFDENAILLFPRESRLLFEEACLKVQKTKYLLFFPYMFRYFSKLELFLCWLPLGAQYCVRVTK